MPPAQLNRGVNLSQLLCTDEVCPIPQLIR